MAWRPKAPPPRPEILVVVGVRESNVRIEPCDRDGNGLGYFFTHEARIHKSSALLVPKPDTGKSSYGRWMTDYELCPQVKKWLGDRRHSISYQGEWLILHMTKEMAGLFKVFFT